MDEGRKAIVSKNVDRVCTGKLIVHHQWYADYSIYQSNNKKGV